MAKIEFFCDTLTKTMDKNKGRPTSLPMKVSVDIVLTQYSVYVWEPIEDFPCDLGVRDNALIPIVLQGTRGKEQSLANLPSCEIDSPSKRGRWVWAVLLTRFVKPLMPRDELFHLWCFFIDVLQSTPLISKSLPIRIAPNGNLLLLSQIARNKKIEGDYFSSIRGRSCRPMV